MERANNYVLKIYQMKSFSKAAKALYISQPSLSATIKKLESELGFQIFDRTTNPLSLTRKGEIYIEYLEESIINEKNLNRRIKSLSTLSHEKLVVSGTNYLSYKVIPVICGMLHKKYPNAEITVDLGGGSNKAMLYERVYQGSINLMLNYDCDEKRFSCVPLQIESFVVAMKKDNVKSKELLNYALTYQEIVSNNIDKKKIISDYSLFSEVEFLRVSKSSSIQRYVHKFIENGSLSSCHIYNSKTLDAHYSMMTNGMGAVVTTDYLIKNMKEDKDILYFVTDYPDNSRQAKLIYKKDKALSKIEKEFIELTVSYFSKKETDV